MIILKITRGIACNCSEGVIRLKRSDYEQIKSDFLDEGMEKLRALIAKEENVPLWHLAQLGSDNPVPGYSEMRPHSDDEVCIYYYQTDGRMLVQILEQLRIPFDTQQWTVGWREGFAERFYRISEPGGLLVKDIEKLYGKENGKEGDDYWDFWRRKPYDECPPPSDMSLTELLDILFPPEKESDEGDI